MEKTINLGDIEIFPKMEGEFKTIGDLEKFAKSMDMFITHIPYLVRLFEKLGISKNLDSYKYSVIDRISVDCYSFDERMISADIWDGEEIDLFLSGEEIEVFDDNGNSTFVDKSSHSIEGIYEYHGNYFIAKTI